MVPFKSTVAASLACSGVALSADVPRQGDCLPGCGELDLFFTGIPAYHPLVTALGEDPDKINRTVHLDAQNLINAGYNIRVVLAGPEVPISVFQDEMRRDRTGKSWNATGIGFGLRGYQRQDTTVEFTDLITLFRSEAPEAPILFDYNTTTFLWATQQYLPLSSDCVGAAGADLGFTVLCHIC
ncbi:hypothetical protein GGR57DRAFT_100004 [Xylariaceae sp. FL1272]|nr:hypothetical protein GGR57DRAFT_100004 [Xylariaceae sp. FL1272]